MKDILITGGLVINEGEKMFRIFLFKILRIEKIGNNLFPTSSYEILNAENKLVLPGLIDDQVHFREPGLAHDIYTYRVKSGSCWWGHHLF